MYNSNFMRIHRAALALLAATLRNFQKTTSAGNYTAINHSNKIQLKPPCPHPPPLTLTFQPIPNPLSKVPKARVKRPSIGNSFASELLDNTKPSVRSSPHLISFLLISSSFYHFSYSTISPTKYLFPRRWSAHSDPVHGRGGHL